MVVYAAIHVWLGYGYVTVAYCLAVFVFYFFALFCFFGRVVCLFVVWYNYPLQGKGKIK
jgi:hypothetical protein